jgi:hypothetical protein
VTVEIGVENRIVMDPKKVERSDERDVEERRVTIPITSVVRGGAQSTLKMA